MSLLCFCVLHCKYLIAIPSTPHFSSSFSFASLATCQMDIATWMSLHHLKGSTFKHGIIFLSKLVLTLPRIARFSQSLRFTILFSFYIWLVIKITSFIKSLVLTPSFPFTLVLLLSWPKYLCLSFLQSPQSSPCCLYLPYQHISIRAVRRIFIPQFLATLSFDYYFLPFGCRYLS